MELVELSPIVVESHPEVLKPSCAPQERPQIMGKFHQWWRKAKQKFRETQPSAARVEGTGRYGVYRAFM